MLSNKGLWKRRTCGLGVCLMFRRRFTAVAQPPRSVVSPHLSSRYPSRYTDPSSVSSTEMCGEWISMSSFLLRCIEAPKRFKTRATLY